MQKEGIKITKEKLTEVLNSLPEKGTGSVGVPVKPIGKLFGWINFEWDSELEDWVLLIKK